MPAESKNRGQTDFIDGEDITDDDNDIDIVIVGAGLTGLCCAYNILRKSSGLDVLIIEAKSGVGGRLLSREYSETYYASFSQNYVTRLAESLNLSRFSGGNHVGKKKILYTKNGPIDDLRGYVGAEVYSFFQTLDEETENTSLQISKPHGFTGNLGRMSVEQLLGRCAVAVIATDPTQHKNIEIQPAPEEAFLRAQGLYTGAPTTFFNIEYNRPFWSGVSTGTILTTGNSNSAMTFLYDGTCHKGDVNKHVLAGYANETSGLKSAFDVLNECFRTSEVAEYVKYVKYESKEYFDGTAGFPMSVMKPDSIGRPMSYTESLDDRIFFASSEYAKSWPGTVDGAIEAGENTAYLVLASIRPQTLTFNDMTQITYRKHEIIPAAPFPLVAMQYLGIVLNLAILTSFLRGTLRNIIGSLKR